MLKLIVAVLMVIVFRTGCANDDQGSSAWNIPHRIDHHSRLGLAYQKQDRLAAAKEKIQCRLTQGPNKLSIHHAIALPMVSGAQGG